MNFKIQIDTESFSRKPKGEEIGKIKERLPKQIPQEIGVKRFAEFVMQGRSFSPGTLSGGACAENWTEQQIFGIDIDNEDKKLAKEHIKSRAENPLTVEDILKRCADSTIKPSLIYETFSSSPNWQKYRIIFVMDRITADGAERDKVQKTLISLFPECDGVCVNRDRLFFGGKKISFIDENAVNTYEKIVGMYKEEPKPVPEKKKFYYNDELDDLKKMFDFLGYIRSFGGTEKRRGKVVYFNPCPICGHNDDFAFYPETNSFMCFGASGNVGGSIIDFLMHTRKIDKKQAVHVLKHELCGIHEHDDYKITIKGAKQAKTPLRTLDDTGNAQRMNDLCGDVVKFNYTDNCFMYYTSGKWKCDNRGVVLGYADEMLERLKMELKQWTELDGGAYLQDYHKHCKKSRSNASKRAMVREFEHLVPVAPSDFDRDKLLVNAQNGVIDLKTGEIVPHSPDFLMTRMLGTSLTKSQKKPEKWLNFLSETFGGSAEMVLYIQKLMGYMLSGETSEQCVFFMFGNGSNGKSVLLEVIRRLLGDYSTNVQPESIMIKQNSGGANSDIARLKGARFVTCTEPNEGMRLNEGLIKQMTGGDVMTARKLYGNEFEFKPEFKFCMATNHKPLIRGTDYGVWRRMRIIPFNFTVPDGRKDPALVEKLAQELPEILAWAVEGYKLWRTEGLDSPKCVEEAGKEYRNEMDVISAFLDSEYVQSGGECKSGVLYALYCKWADDNNEYKMSSRKFGLEIGKRYNKIRKKDTTYYQGISNISITIG